MSWLPPGLLRRVHGSRSLRAVLGAKAALASALLSLFATPAATQELTHDRFAAVMNSVFGRDAWRMTGGYRTPAREDQLRAEGAMTVRPGGVSRHSLGRPGAPGAYDLVVDGMSPFEAARRLRAAGAPFARYQPKGAHGTQGPHLHLEPYGFGPAPGAAPRVQMASTSPPKLRARRPGAITIVMPAAGRDSLLAARAEFRGLRERALERQPEAQLELGRRYALGYAVPRDYAEAQAWVAAAAANPRADADLRAEAAATFRQVVELMAADRAERPGHYASLSAGASAP